MAFRELVDRYQNKVFSIIYGILRSRNDAEDISQQVFTKIYFSIGNFDFRSSLLTWIYKITVNECYDYLRKKKVRKLVYESDFSEEEAQRMERTEPGSDGQVLMDDRLAQRDFVLKLLEKFLASHPSHDQFTPDAMFRLADLYIDVADQDSWAAAVTLAEEHFGPVTTLVNNAGVLERGSVTELEPDAWDRVLAVNLKGAYLGMRAAIPSMLRAGGGSIVNIASVSGVAGGLRYAAYNASKGGLITLTKGVALDYADRNIRANTICPGSVATPMNAKTPKSFVLDATPMGRRGTPAEIAACVVFLASDASSYVTGHDLVADGGYLAW